MILQLYNKELYGVQDVRVCYRSLNYYMHYSLRVPYYIYIYIYINSIIYPLEACSTYSDPNIRTIRVSAESREILHKRFLQHSPLVSQEPPRTLVDLFV